MADSLLSTLRSNARLKSHINDAKKTEVKDSRQSNDYTGPDGDVIVRLSGTYVGTHKTDGYLQAILEFSVIDGEYADQRMIKYFGFRDSEYGTAEEVLDEYFESLQRLGIETADKTDEEIEAQIDALKTKRTPQKVRVRTKNGRQRVYLNGLATEATTDYTYAEKEVAAPEPEDEWGDTGEPEDTSENAVEGELSDWIGFKVYHKPPRSPKEHEFEVVAVNEETMTMTLSKGGKTIADVPLDKIRFPE